MRGGTDEEGGMDDGAAQMVTSGSDVRQRCSDGSPLGRV